MSHKIFLPITMREIKAHGEIAKLLLEDENQQRKSLKPNVILMKVAQAKALDMARRHYRSHINPDGFGPNYLVKNAGYQLPSYYDQTPTGNNIESLALGQPTAQQAWNAWLASEGHREHVLGLNDFYAEQDEYGVGFVDVEESVYRWYWIMLIAKEGER